jgi:hypothetical protein
METRVAQAAMNGSQHRTVVQLDHKRSARERAARVGTTEFASVDVIPDSLCEVWEMSLFERRTNF